MGSIEFIRLNTGERTTIETDGTMIKDQVEPPKLEWCDKCQSWQDMQFGQFEKHDGISTLWYCVGCK